MPLTRRALELRDQFLYTDVRLALCVGTWQTGATESEINTSIVYQTEPGTVSITWDGFKNQILIVFLVGTTTNANRVALVRGTEVIATFILQFEQTFVANQEVRVDGRTISG